MHCVIFQTTNKTNHGFKIIIFHYDIFGFESRVFYKYILISFYSMFKIEILHT